MFSGNTNENSLEFQFDRERINHLQWRLTRLENFLGKSNQKPLVETINDLNEQLFRHTTSNMNVRKVLNKADEINRLTSSNFQQYLISDRSTKLELILADEERIRDVTKNLSQIDTLANVLNKDYFQEIPKLSGSLNKLLITHEKIKNDHGQFTAELSAFLQDYAAFALTMDENLQQYKKLGQKKEHIVTENED